jgi:hypothetical protein
MTGMQFGLRKLAETLAGKRERMEVIHWVKGCKKKARSMP